MTGPLKRVLLFEQFFGGHHTNYLEALLPTLIEYQQTGAIGEIGLAITRRHYEADCFREQLARFEPHVTIDATVPEVNPAVPFADRIRIARYIKEAAKRFAPDFLYSTTADNENIIMAARPVKARHPFGVPLHATGLLHFGHGGKADRLKDRAKDIIYQLAMKRSPWDRILIVNPVVYEWADRQKALKSRARLVPDPVPDMAIFDKNAARAKLGLPLEGRYVGHVGTTDGRKAIPELLQAFRKAARDDDRLLLAGKLSGDHRALIDNVYADLLASGRIQLIDRYLHTDELPAAFCAIDLAAILHYPRAELSANFLKAISARRPVIVDNYGYTGMMVERFALGTSCDVLNAEALQQSLRLALDKATSYQPSERANRLVEFHRPENFARTVLSDLLTLIEPGARDSERDWQWVNR